MGAGDIVLVHTGHVGWKLGLDRIDLYQLHRIDPQVPLADQIGELVALQDEGKIGHIGLSEVVIAGDGDRAGGQVHGDSGDAGQLVDLLSDVDDDGNIT